MRSAEVRGLLLKDVDQGRRRLLTEVADIDNALDRDTPPASDERIYLENQLARRRWLLMRYPDLAHS